VSVYEGAGGDAAFRRLVDRFYERVEADPELRPVFPADLGPGKEWQFLFLTQFFGGPARYDAQRGHPRLRMRHLPFTVTPSGASRWLAHMLAAIDETGIPEPAATAMRAYFRQAAPAMINRGVQLGTGRPERLEAPPPPERTEVE
jgi:hemoglobin